MLGAKLEKTEQKTFHVASQAMAGIQRDIAEYGDADAQRDTTTQISCRLADASSVSAHAESLNRVPLKSTRASLVRLQRVYGNKFVQRVVDLRRFGQGETSVAPEIEQSIQSAQGGGQPLDARVRAQMEKHFGADFSAVRVHSDADADKLNQSLGARAFTTRQDVFFKQGEYNPETPSGRELLAHELTHVVQQVGNKMRPKLTVNTPDDIYEKEADKMAQQIMQTEQHSFSAKANQGTLSREQEEEDERLATVENMDCRHCAMQQETNAAQSNLAVDLSWHLQSADLYRKLQTRQPLTSARQVSERTCGGTGIVVQRRSTTVGGTTWYSTRAEAEAAVAAHVSPRRCFVWQGGGPNGFPWRAIPGTGCAHWVAHQMGITGNPGCSDGNVIRVSQLTHGRTSYGLRNAQVGDIWTNPAQSHCGIVRRVTNSSSGAVTSVRVEHCSIASGGVVTSTFNSGLFWR